MEGSTSKLVGSLLHFERGEERIGDILVLNIEEDTVQVVQIVSQERLQPHTFVPQQVQQQNIGSVQVIAAAGRVGVSTAPVHSQARREMFVAEETTHTAWKSKLCTSR